jgi:hypothetical protein
VLPEGAAKFVLLPTVLVPKSPGDEVPVVLRDERVCPNAGWANKAARAATVSAKAVKRALIKHPLRD